MTSKATDYGCHEHRTKSVLRQIAELRRIGQTYLTPGGMMTAEIHRMMLRILPPGTDLFAVMLAATEVGKMCEETINLEKRAARNTK